jgi:hypothetical protein
MKKVLLGLAVLATLAVSAQEVETQKETSFTRAKEATQEGNYMVGLSATSIGATHINGNTNFNGGVSVGAFAKDNLAVVGNVGYATTQFEGVNTNDWFYGAGLRYYVASVVPVQVDWKGSVGNSFHPGASFVGVQLGYAWFPFTNFSVEPTIRHDFSTKDQYQNVLSANLGFNLYF